MEERDAHLYYIAPENALTVVPTLMSIEGLLMRLFKACEFTWLVQHLFSF